ncbi:MAG: 2-oxoacid:ferredoxin oxidoreductase subunit beta [Anaerolineales bacterium]|nr:2-oxoacid:ferredoxin oxidoreductase subunit beta [Anaerolineales bacterium]MCB9144095.1 2-oxoacid:ferredoxin oxidoreductase subunit beta [Anaerolineales bacterium]
MAGAPTNLNSVGLSKSDYRGAPSTLCQGCGHNSISNQIVAAMYEMNVLPEDIIKFSGIGCSSKSPTYFMNRSFGFNSLHGRMPSIATGALFGDARMKGIGVSGDGDTASIGMGQFKHAVRRNINMVYIVENNGVYGLTKGQFSATSEKGLRLKKQGENQYMPIDICMEAVISNATFVARSFAGNPKQVKELLKAAYAHKGISVIDIISPCVTFNNQENAYHSYAWGKDHEEPLHEISYIAPRNEIILENEMQEGEVREVEMHDGSVVVLKNLEKGYDPTDRLLALKSLEEAQQNAWMLTGLIYVETEKPALTQLYNLVDEPLNRVPAEDLRPERSMIDKVNSLMF